jgi:purine-binding chemotaxis protein CheW
MKAGERMRRTVGTARDRTGVQREAVSDTLQIVTFSVGDEEFGLDINAITEAIRPLTVTALPHMPPFIEGVINLRETIIPVVDLRKRFGLPGGRSDSRKTRMVITKGALPAGANGVPALLGLVVDGVREVMHIPRIQVDSAPAAATGRGAEFIAGVARSAGRLVILIDISKILSRDERTALAEAGNVHP